MRLNCWLLTRDQTSGTITSRQIVDLPQYGRDPYQLLRQIEGQGQNAVSETAGTRTAWVIPPFLERSGNDISTSPLYLCLNFSLSFHYPASISYI